jgi:alkylated DNA nucleotide flippase Atl1
MARHGGAVPWHRVVTSAGRLPPGNEQEARQRLLSEAVPLCGDHVDMRRAAWSPS